MHEFTCGSRRVNARLNQELENFGPYDSVPEEICLIALLRETGGVAARAFEALGVDRTRLRKDLARVVPPPRSFGFADMMARGSVSAEHQRIITQYPYHGTLHDLVMALRDHEGNIGRAFANHNITIPQVLAKALEFADTDGSSEGGTLPVHGNRTFDQWLALVASEDSHLRHDASMHVASQLAELSEEEKARVAKDVIRAMKTVLHDASNNVRWSAARALAHVSRQAPEALNLLAEVVQDPDPWVRSEAALCFWNAGGSLETVLPVLREGLASNDEKVRTHAWCTLQQLAGASTNVPDEVVTLVIQSLGSRDAAITTGAVVTLMSLGPKARMAKPVLIELLTQSEPRQQLHPFALPGMPPLPADHYAILLVTTLVQICQGSADLMPSFVQLLQDKRHLRPAVLLGLSMLGAAARDAVPQIEACIADEDAATRLRAVMALWRIAGEVRHLPGLIELTTHSDPTIACAALTALAEMAPANPAALAVLENSLTARDSALRVKAAELLLKSGRDPDRMRQILADAAESSGRQLPFPAVNWLDAAGGKESDPLPDEWAEEWVEDRETRHPNIFGSSVPPAPPTGHPADPFDEELDLWREAIRIDPLDSQAYCLRGAANERAKKYDEALVDYQRATTLEPDNRSFVNRQAELWNVRAIAAKRAGQLERALMDYGTAIGLAPQNSELYRNRAKVHFLMEDPARAFADLELAHALAAADPVACNDLAWYLATTPDETFRDARRALQLATVACQATSHKNLGMLDTLAVAHGALGEFDAALDWINKALSNSMPAEVREELKQHQELFRDGKPVLG